MDIRLLATSGYGFYSSTTPIPVDADDCTSYIWNGTGLDDGDGSWDHSGAGVENSTSKYAGTNGLDASSLVNGSIITFSNTTGVDIVNYDVLVLWLKIISWQATKHLTVQFYNTGDILNLEFYADLDITNTWQQVYIPLEDFNVPAVGATKTVTNLRFTSYGNIGIYLDNMYFSIGAVYKLLIPTCEPSMTATSFGSLSIRTKETV